MTRLLTYGNRLNTLAARLGFDAKLLSEVCGVVNAALLDFYEWALRDRGAAGQGAGANRGSKLQSGTVTVVQRTSSDLRLNPHLHAVWVGRGRVSSGTASC